MFDRPGIGLDDLEWIHRDQYVHYVELAHALNSAHDWPLLRRALLDALTAAFGLERGDGMDRLTPRQLRTLDVLDEIHREHDPAGNWPAFSGGLWKQRHAIRRDLP